MFFHYIANSYNTFLHSPYTCKHVNKKKRNQFDFLDSEYDLCPMGCVAIWVRMTLSAK